MNIKTNNKQKSPIVRYYGWGMGCLCASELKETVFGIQRCIHSSVLNTFSKSDSDVETFHLVHTACFNNPKFGDSLGALIFLLAGAVNLDVGGLDK